MSVLLALNHRDSVHVLPVAAREPLENSDTTCRKRGRNIDHRQASGYQRHVPVHYAALNTGPAKSWVTPQRRYPSDDFLALLAQVVASPRGRETHIILDNLADPRNPELRTLLAADPRAQLHFIAHVLVGLNQV